MSTYENFPLVRFYPAEICENKDWYVKFYVWNPFTERMTLRRIKINRIKNVAERRKFSRELNAKLEMGWNPFVEQESAKNFPVANLRIYLFVAPPYFSFRFAGCL